MKEMISRAPTVRNNQGNAARASFRGDHAKSLCLATVNQRVAAGEQASKFVPMVDGVDDARVGGPAREAFESSPPRSVTDKQQSDMRVESVRRANDHFPPLLRGESAKSEQE